jgi:hypothetical protein
MSAKVDLSFPHAWQAEILPQRPLILPPRRFIYPREAEEIERGALEVLIHPPADTPFLATFALGFADPIAPSGVWSCPNPDELCALAGGYAYIVNAAAPERFTQIELRPVLHVEPLVAHGLLLFAGSYAMLAWGADGRAWQTARLSSEGLRIAKIQGDELHGFGWDLIADREIPFIIDLRSGKNLPPADSRKHDGLSG